MKSMKRNWKEPKEFAELKQEVVKLRRQLARSQKEVSRLTDKLSELEALKTDEATVVTPVSDLEMCLTCGASLFILTTPSGKQVKTCKTCRMRL